MSSMFDVDCPRTPDGGDGDDKKKSDARLKQSRASRPPSNRPPRSRSSAAARNRSASSGRSGNRHHGTPRKAGASPRSASARKKLPFTPRAPSNRKSSSTVGLEPEEYIAPQRSAPPGGVPAAPGSGGYRAAPNSGNGGDVVPNRNRSHSTEAFGGLGGGGGGTNPFDTEGGGNRGRTSSGNWWKEEIVDEGMDKGAALDKHYGLNSKEKRDLYGPSAGADGTSDGGPFDVERGTANQPSRPQTNGNGHTNTLHGNIYQQASSMNNDGYYSSANTASPNPTPAVDDYSFSNVNLTPHGNNGSRHGLSPGRMASPGNRTPGTSAAKSMQLPKWFGALASSVSKQDTGGYMPPNVNIAPRGSSSEEWVAKSPGVTFDCFHPDGLNKKKHGFLGGMSHAQRVGFGALLVAVVCTIFGVTVSELKKANNNMPPEGYGSEVQGMNPILPITAEPTLDPTPWPETPVPTPTPSSSPTTGRPTRSPATNSPIAGNGAVHGKESDGTPRPTRSPVTVRPTGSPVTMDPTNAPTSTPTTAPTESPTVEVQGVQAAPGAGGDCEDETTGFYRNHLDNPKNCYWLDNGKGELYTDRKDKNCGGRAVPNELGRGTTTYPTTEVGRMCRRTCGPYNGCGVTPTSNNDVSTMMPMAGGGNSGDDSCLDSSGIFINHLDNPKDCQWLFNGKPGQTDRKDKNCGFSVYPITKLGDACRQTCAMYGNNGCTDVGGMGLSSMSSSGGQIAMRGDVLAMETSSSSSSSSSTSSMYTRGRPLCRDEDGDFINHLDNPKNCEWLFNEKPGQTDRKDKNCGSDEYPEMTALGRACKNTCSMYTGECDKDGNAARAKRQGDFLRPTPVTSSSENDKNERTSQCKDRKGRFLNHRNSRKDCEWLFNDKPGVTDRKDMNCGSEEHPIPTELGMACPETCAPYIDAREGGCGTKVLGELTLANGSVMRSFTSSNYSFSLTSPSSSLGSSGSDSGSNTNTRSTACINGEGTYLDHKHALKSCEWLMGVGHEKHQSMAEHRQQKNCGGQEHEITELGMKCPWSCKEYNGCN